MFCFGDLDIICVCSSTNDLRIYIQYLHISPCTGRNGGDNAGTLLSGHGHHGEDVYLVEGAEGGLCKYK